MRLSYYSTEMQLFKLDYWLNLVSLTIIIKRHDLVKFLDFNLVTSVRINPLTRCLSEHRLHCTSGMSWVPASAIKLRKFLRLTTTAELQSKSSNCTDSRFTSIMNSDSFKLLLACLNDCHNFKMK